MLCEYPHLKTQESQKNRGSKRQRQIQYYLYAESNKSDTKELICQTETNSDFKINLIVTIGETIRERRFGRGGMTYTHYCIK